MEINWLELLGYLASVVVLISLLMSSIIKLRWINLAGSSLFSLYGFLIGALPVGFMNLGIAIINIYYLNKIYKSKDDFQLLSIEDNKQYFKYFLNFHRAGIEKLTNISKLETSNYDVSFFVLRNMVPAGIFLGTKYDDNTVKVELDYVIPEYRDFKIGKYVYETNKSYFLDKGYTKFISYSSDPYHIKYLKKMGFEEKDENGNTVFVKAI